MMQRMSWIHWFDQGAAMVLGMTRVEVALIYRSPLSRD
jgi:hypothetical protein